MYFIISLISNLSSLITSSIRKYLDESLLGTPFGVVGLRHVPTPASQQNPSDGSVAGLPSERLHTTCFRGATFRSATTVLTKLLHLQQPPPSSTLQIRIRSVARHLPGHRLTVCILIAMVDFIHDRLQLLNHHESTWAFIRSSIIDALRRGDYPLLDEYYQDKVRNHSHVLWKPIHPGKIQIRSSVVAAAIAEPDYPASSSYASSRPTPASSPMDDCVKNLVEEEVICKCNEPLPTTMSLFLKPKDDTTARVICDLRPLNSKYSRKPPGFRLPSVASLMQATRWWDQSYFTKLDITAYFHSLFLRDVDLCRLVPFGLSETPLYSVTVAKLCPGGGSPSAGAGLLTLRSERWKPSSPRLWAVSLGFYGPPPCCSRNCDANSSHSGLR